MIVSHNIFFFKDRAELCYLSQGSVLDVLRAHITRIEEHLIAPYPTSPLGK